MKHAAVYLLAGLVQKAAPFLLVPFFTRAMSPDEFGRLSFWMATLAAVQIVSGLGIDAAVSRLYHDHTSDERLQRSFLLSMVAWRWLLAIAVGPLLYMAGKLSAGLWLDSQSLDPYWGIVIAAAAMQAVIDTILASYRTSRRVVQYMGVVVTSACLLIAANVLFVGYLRWNAVGALLATLASVSVTAVIASLVFIRRLRPAEVQLSYLWPSMKYGLPTVPQKVGTWINNLSNRVLLAQFVSLTAVAQYQLAYTGAALLTLLVTSVNSAYVPWYYQRRLGGNKDRDLIIALDYGIIAVIGTACLGLAIFAREFIRIFAPPSYQSAELFVPAIAAAYFVFAQYTQFLKVLHFHKRTGLASAAVMIPGLMTIPVNLLAIPSFGALGAAWVTYAAFGSTLLIVIALARKLDDERHNLYRLAAANIFSIVVILLAPLANHWDEWPLLVVLGAKLGGWCVLSVLLILVLCGTSVRTLINKARR